MCEQLEAHLQFKHHIYFGVTPFKMMRKKVQTAYWDQRTVLYRQINRQYGSQKTKTVTSPLQSWDERLIESAYISI